MEVRLGGEREIPSRPCLAQRDVGAARLKGLGLRPYLVWPSRLEWREVVLAVAVREHARGDVPSQGAGRHGDALECLAGRRCDGPPQGLGGLAEGHCLGHVRRLYVHQPVYHRRPESLDSLEVANDRVDLLRTERVFERGHRGRAFRDEQSHRAFAVLPFDIPLGERRPIGCCADESRPRASGRRHRRIVTGVAALLEQKRPLPFARVQRRQKVGVGDAKHLRLHAPCGAHPLFNVGGHVRRFR